MTATRLSLYKTAFSPLYETYVEILKVREDGVGGHIIDGRVAFKTDTVLFRPHELTDYCL